MFDFGFVRGKVFGGIMVGGWGYGVGMIILWVWFGLFFVGLCYVYVVGW